MSVLSSCLQPGHLLKKIWREKLILFLDHFYVQKALGVLHKGGPSAGFWQSCLLSHSSHYLVAMTTSGLESRLLGRHADEPHAFPGAVWEPHETSACTWHPPWCHSHSHNLRALGMLRLLGGLPCPGVWQPAPSSTAPRVALGVALLTPASLLSSGMGSMLFYTQGYVWRPSSLLPA